MSAVRKEEFRTTCDRIINRAQAERSLLAWTWKVRVTGSRYLVRFTNTLRNGWHEFLNCFDDRVSQGFVEGINRAIRNIINRVPLTFSQLYTKLTSEIHYRVGSPLEVGTGFHPELTGRENIYLKGGIPSIYSGQAWG